MLQVKYEVDGDATNNSEENLRLICPNCHAQTDTYKGRNKGKSKRKYYVTYRDFSKQENIDGLINYTPN